MLSSSGPTSPFEEQANLLGGLSTYEFNSNDTEACEPTSSGPGLGLIDDEGLFVLPPEDAEESGSEVHYNDTVSTSAHRSSSKCIDLLNDSSLRSCPNDFETKQRKRRRKKRVYTVNLSNCKYESVRRVLRRFGFREVGEEEEWNLYWTDFSVSLDRVVVMKSWQKINHFPGMSELCRKDSLARNLNRMAKRFPKEYAIFPKTWCLPSDWNELQNYARKRKSKTYIFKPDTGCQGRGIYITKSVKDIRSMDNMICQVYLSKPFVIDGYKFDLRLYVLLTSCEPLRIFMFKDGLVRFTTVQYAEPSIRNVNNLYMHLTNYALQKHSNEYIRDDEEGGTKRRVTTLNRWFREHGHDLQKIWNDIDDVVIKTVLSGYPILRHNYRTCFPNHVQTSACFEVLGFDIMLNHNLKPYVLEVNHSPSFSTDSKLDKEIKEAMLWDTLQLAHFGMLNKKKCVEDERKRIRNRLMQKAVRKDVRETYEKEFAHFNEAAERYERSHLGNYRMIYPSANKEKYEQFMNPQATFYQETVTYKVRSECARQMREEIRMKQEKLDALQHRSRPIGPESPAPKKMAPKSLTARPRLQSKSETEQRCLRNEPSDEAQHPWGDQVIALNSVTDELNVPQSGDARASWEAQPIVAEEEASRLEALKRRERLMHAVGLVEAIHRLLAGSSGVVSTIGAPLHKKIPLKVAEKHYEATASEHEQKHNEIPKNLGEINEQAIHGRQKNIENWEAATVSGNVDVNVHTPSLKVYPAVNQPPERNNAIIARTGVMSNVLQQHRNTTELCNKIVAINQRATTADSHLNRYFAPKHHPNSLESLSSVPESGYMHPALSSSSDIPVFCRGVLRPSFDGINDDEKCAPLKRQTKIYNFGLLDRDGEQINPALKAPSVKRHSSITNRTVCPLKEPRFFSDVNNSALEIRSASLDRRPGRMTSALTGMKQSVKSISASQVRTRMNPVVSFHLEPTEPMNITDR